MDLFAIVRLHTAAPRLNVDRIQAVCLCVLISLGVLSPRVFAAELSIVTIVAPGSPHRSSKSADLASIFRRLLRFTKTGEAIVPVNLPLSDPLREGFTLSLYGVKPEAMEAYWNERYFHGVSPPHVVASSEAMLRFVASTPNAIGYVLSCQVDERVVILTSLPLTDVDPRLRELCAEHENKLVIPELQTKLAP
jgi:hypothetical protein